MVDLVTLTADGASAVVAGDGAELRIEEGEWLLNPGSVGQPRDGDPRAAWALFDSTTRQLTFLRVPYERAPVIAALRSLGLPEVLTGRLETAR